MGGGDAVEAVERGGDGFVTYSRSKQATSTRDMDETPPLSSHFSTVRGGTPQDSASARCVIPWRAR